MSVNAFFKIGIFLSCCLLCSVAAGQDIAWDVVAAGGTEGTSTDFILNATAGQTAIGSSSSTSFVINAGYWQKFPGDPCCDYPGDVNNSLSLNILDVTFLINFLYKSGPDPACMPEGDADGDGAINILDVVRIINYLYKSGPPPICGPDPWPY